MSHAVLGHSRWTGQGGEFWQKVVHWIQFSHSVVSNSLRPHGLQHTRLPCLSSTPRAYSNSCPLSWWCPPTILFSVIPFSSCPQSFPTSWSFPMSQFFASGIGVPKYWSFSLNISLSNKHSGLISFRMDWMMDKDDLLAVQGTLKSLLQYYSSEASVLQRSAFFITFSANDHDLTLK